MATVYLADDLKHHRKVALKVLRPELAAILGAERFFKEIEVTANLQHPNILPLYDSGEADTLLYYVMPYVDGESLRHRLNREKQLGVEDTVAIATAVAGALEYAHEQGIIHRDIKPENILLTRGQPLVADFGIALAISHAGGTRLTETGLSLGTPHYMSPEQAMGDRELDARSDVYSLGATVYELLVGEPPHVGNSAQAIIAKILSDIPAPITRSRQFVPPNVDAAVQQALAKSPADRFTSAARFAEALTNPTFRLPTAPGAAGGGPKPGRRVVVLGALLVLSAALAFWVSWFLYSRSAPATTSVARFTMVLPTDTHLTSGIAVSPDGAHIVYAAMTGQGESRLYLRSVDQFESRPVAGTEGGDNPFFSPDGRWVGFFVAGAIKKVFLPGGASFEICRTGCDVYPSDVRGASWDADNTIVFGGGFRRGLLRVSAAGGAPQELTRPDVARGETGHGGPHVLPDGRGVLFTVGTGQGSHIALLDPQTGKWRKLFQGASPQYLPTGEIVYLGSGSLRSVAFDISRNEVSGDPAPVADTVRWGSTAGFESGLFAVSPGGVLVFVPSASVLHGERRLVWVNRKGEVTPIMADAGRYLGPRVSPDGRSIAVGMLANDGMGKIWMIDTRGAASPLAIEGANYDPVWAPDGKRVAFVSNGNIALISSDKSDGAEIILKREFYTRPFSWAPDGRTLAFIEERPATTGTDIWTLRVDTAREPEPFLVTSANETEPMFSPDGRWLAYVSDESGRSEVYVTPFPGPGGRFRISAAGGDFPLWSPDGRELFFRTGNGPRWWFRTELQQVVVVTLHYGPTVEASPPQLLFQGAYFGNPGVSGNYDISRDGRFLMVEQTPRAVVDQLNVVLNWSGEPKRRAAAK